MPYRLMIVDDSDTARSKIERCFIGSNIKVVATASSGADAVLKLDEYYPDVVTVDLHMPQMDGVECVKRLIAKQPNIGILIVSESSDCLFALQAIKAGARGFVKKPFGENTLLHAVQKVLQSTNANPY